jgi:hypothetical protein
MKNNEIAVMRAVALSFKLHFMPEEECSILSMKNKDSVEARDF